MNSLHPDDRDRVVSAFEQATANGEAFDEEFRLYARDGSLVWLQNRSRLVLDANDEPIYRMGVAVDISELKRLECHLATQAYVDQLTGLRNRTWFTERLQSVWEQQQIDQHLQFAVIFIDLDDFKVVNDTLGHSTGDQLLRMIGERVTEQLPPQAMLARLGGDEFTILLERLDDPDDARALAEDVVASLSEPVRLLERDLIIDASVGIAVSGPEDPADPEQLLTRADLAMYDAKHGGQRTISVFEPRMSSSIWKRMNTEVALRRAIVNEELVVHYQPVIDLQTGKAIELEALLRWQHPEYGLVPPAEFIPIAEQSGMIHEIGRWTMETAAAQVMEWRNELGLDSLRLAVNLSSVQYGHTSLYDSIVDVLERTGLPSEQLTLEITESRVLDDSEPTTETLARLRAAGIHLAIDDFGTGFSSLRYLKRYPVDVLKIDRTFISDINENPHDLAIVEAIIAVASTLNLAVTAEGVETINQVQSLVALGCGHGQGFHFSPPRPANEVAPLLTSSFTY